MNQSLVAVKKYISVYPNTYFESLLVNRTAALASKRAPEIGGVNKD